MKQYNRLFGFFAALSIFFGVFAGAADNASAQTSEERILVEAEVDGSLTQSQRVALVDNYKDNHFDGLDLDGHFLIDGTTLTANVEGPSKDVRTALDKVINDANFSDVEVIGRADLGGPEVSSMVYHTELDARSEQNITPATNNLASIGVQVTLKAGLSESEVLGFADSVDSVFDNIRVGGYFILNPNIHFILNPNIHFLRIEGSEGDVASALDSVSNIDDVEDIEVLDETYPEKPSWNTFVIHTFNDPR
jgi:hypothetical protein